MKDKFSTAVFAGGCFWCMQPPFDKAKGVIKTVVGYANGHVPHPTYQEVCSGATGHAEAVEVTYDPQEISYESLLDIFWRNIDPTALNRQFYDLGTQYRSAIFHKGEQQQKEALRSRENLANSGRFSKPIVTEIFPLASFFPAEEEHQNFCYKQLDRYQSYREGSGRERFLKEAWGELLPAGNNSESRKS